MAILTLLTDPDPRLRYQSQSVDKIDDKILTLICDMEETMENAHGCGLAAPQVNVHKRIFVMQCKLNGPPDVFINPEIVSFSEEKNSIKEGCLSIPEHYAEVSRSRSIVVRFLDERGQLHEKMFDGLESICIQHETDHLDGILFTDYLSNMDDSLSSLFKHQ